MKFARLVCLFALFAITTAVAQTNPVPWVNQPLVPATLHPGGARFYADSEWYGLRLRFVDQLERHSVDHHLRQQLAIDRDGAGVEHRHCQRSFHHSIEPRPWRRRTRMSYSSKSRRPLI